MDFLQVKGKRFIISGVANERSIAWACAQMLHEAGAELAFFYLERVEKWVVKLVEPMKNCYCVPFDAADDASVDKAFAEVNQRWGKIDGMLHSIAFASKEALLKPFRELQRADFLQAQDISAYSLVAMSRRAAELMPEGGSIVALTFIGATRAMGGYHVMGAAKASLESAGRYLAHELGQQNIRVNLISAGPLNTLSARGIPGFSKLAEHIHAGCALKDAELSTQDVAESAVFFFSPRSRKITGHILFVDSGYHMMGR